MASLEYAKCNMEKGVYALELRVLRYFLAVAREESISAAAEYLHITQPTLSRQLMELERELGAQLFTRSRKNRRIVLTDAGMRLRRRAEEIVELADKTEAEFAAGEEAVEGAVYLGGGESSAMALVARTARRMRLQYPQVRFDLFSGNADDVLERLDKGLLDFGLLVGSANLERYDCLRLPQTDVWGLLLRRDHPLARQAAVSPGDLAGLPLLGARQTLIRNELAGWYGGDVEQLHIVANFNLINNAARLVEEGLGCALCLEGLLNTTGESALCFRPFSPPLRLHLVLVWKKFQVFSRAAEAFLQTFREVLAETDETPGP